MYTRQPCMAVQWNQAQAGITRSRGVLGNRGPGRPGPLFTSGRPNLGFRRRGSVALAEFIDASAGIHYFLLAGIERMAIRADFDLQIMADGRARLERIAASASDGNCFVFGVDGGLHVNLVVAGGRIDEPDES